MSDPLVSVIIPTYNNANTIRRAVESVLAQSVSDLEVIIVDDGSTDETTDVINGITDARIKYLKQINGGVSSARNAGLLQARGKYIAFLDSDDYWLSSKLEKQVNLFQLNPSMGLVYSQAYIVNKDGRCLDIIGCPLDQKDNIDKYYDRLLLGNFIPSPTPLITQDCYHKIGFFDVHFRTPSSEDWDYWLRIARHYQIGYVDEPLACYQVINSGNPLMKLADRDAQGAYLYVVDKARMAGGCSENFYNLALANAWFRGALIDLGIGNEREAQVRLRTAYKYDPDLFQKINKHTTERICEIADQIYKFTHGVETGKQFINSLYKALPESFLGLQKRKVLGNYYARLFFQGYSQGHLDIVRSSFWPMITNDPNWLANRGVWSLGIEAYLGKQVAWRLRRMVNRTESNPEHLEKNSIPDY